MIILLYNEYNEWINTEDPIFLLIVVIDHWYAWNGISLPQQWDLFCDILNNDPQSSLFKEQ